MKYFTSTAGKWILFAALSIGTLWTTIPYTVQVLLTLMGLDIFTGLLAAIRTRVVSSSAMLKGLITKIAIFCFLWLLHILEEPFHLNFEFERIGALFFIVYEAISIVENCAIAGVKIPLYVVKVLIKAKSAIKPASEDEIKEFSRSSEHNVTVSRHAEFLKTPKGQGDLRATTTKTVIEDREVERVPEGNGKGGS